MMQSCVARCCYSLYGHTNNGGVMGKAILVQKSTHLHVSWYTLTEKQKNTVKDESTKELLRSTKLIEHQGNLLIIIIITITNKRKKMKKIKPWEGDETTLGCRIMGFIVLKNGSLGVEIRHQAVIHKHNLSNTEMDQRDFEEFCYYEVIGINVPKQCRCFEESYSCDSTQKKYGLPVLCTGHSFILKNILKFQILTGSLL